MSDIDQVAPDKLARLRRMLADLLLAAACVLSVWQIGLFFSIAVRRIFYPYALEWMEGGTLDHVARILDGKPLYIAPSIDFTPFIYTPLYYFLCAPVAKVLGLHLYSLRLVSLAASLAVFVLLFRIVVTRTGNAIAGLIACGTYAACFDLCGGFYDLARVDSLALCFLLFGTWLLCCSTKHDFWVGVLFAAAFLTKQSMAMAMPALFAVRFVTQTGFRRVLAGLVFVLIIGVSTWILDRHSGGYYSYYVFELPSQHAWIRSMRTGFWRYDLFGHVPFALVAAAFLLTTRSNWRSALLLWGIALGFIALGWASRMHKGGFTNVLMPTMAFMAIAMGETISRLSSVPRETNTKITVLERCRPTSELSLFWLTMCVAQLAWLSYSARAHVPTSDEREGSDALVAYLRTIKGPILAPFDPLLPRLAGRTGNVHQQALTDISYGTDATKEQLADEAVHAALRERRYAAIVLNGEWQAPLLKLGYTLAPVQVQTAYTKEGASTAASEVWLRVGDALPAAKH